MGLDVLLVGSFQNILRVSCRYGFVPRVHGVLRNRGVGMNFGYDVEQ